MSKVRVGVVELSAEMRPGSHDWEALVAAVRRQRTDLLLLNEMPFGAWISAKPLYQASLWKEACDRHDEGVERLSELETEVVAGSRARNLDGRRVNEAFVWTKDRGGQGAHTKQHFPDEEGYYEARWFQAGERHFKVVEAGALKAGFLICTELMFNERARAYGRAGAQVILVPRAVGKGSLPRWLVAMRMAAIVSGCYVLSPNRNGTAADGQEFGGLGWIIAPDGELVAQTSPSSPLVTHELETDFITRAQKEYPCYVQE